MDGVPGAELLMLLATVNKDGPGSIVPVRHLQKIDDLVEGRADACDGYITDELFELEKRGIPYVMFKPQDFAVDFYGDCLFTSQQRAKDQPEQVLAFRDASLRGWAHALEYPEETIDLILKKYSPGLDRAKLEWEAKEYRRLINPEVIAIGHLNLSRWVAIADVLREHGVVSIQGRSQEALEGFVFKERDGYPGKRWLWGLSIVLLVVAAVAVLLGAAAWILRHLVERRTAELTESNRKLQQEIEERVRIESAMREREENFSNLVGCAFDAILLFDMEGGCRSANQQAADLFGYSLEELLQLNWTKLAHPSDLPKLLKRFQDRVKGLPVPDRYEALFRRKEGRELPLEVSVRKSVWRREDVFITLFRDMTERKRLEAEILKISEWERARIGQDLHDSIGQQLTGLAFLSEAVGDQLRAEGSPRQAEVDKICLYLKAAHGQLRQIVQGLLPLNLSDGLANGLKRLAENAEATLGIDCFFNDELNLDTLSPTLATHLYHIAQESVANAVRHGVAHQVDITLGGSANRGELLIRDDGKGSCPDEDNNHGSGLKIMRYRADLIGGKLTITRNKGACGLTVRCTFDLEAGANPKPEVENEA